MVTEEEGRVKPRSLLVQRVSERVLMTVRKMATLSGSPWYTPTPRGTGAVHHSSEEIVADSPVYIDCMSLQNSVRSMIMSERELDERVVNAAVGIGYVKPGYS